MLDSRLVINNIVFSLILLTAAVSSAADFEELYKKAKELNVEIGSYKADRDAADAKLQATQSAFAPKIGVEGRYESFESILGKETGSTANAYVEWNLFNGFRDRSNRVLTALELKNSQNALQRSESNYRWKLLTIYSRAQALQKVVETYKSTIAENEKLRNGVKARKQAGIVSESELLEFDLYDNKLKLELYDYESDLELVIAELKTHTGVMEFGVFTTNLQPKAVKIKSSDLENLLSASTSQLQDSISEITKAEYEMESVSAGYFPTLDVKATHGSQGLHETTQNPETTLAISAKWELFSGFETSSLRKVAAAKKTQAEAKHTIEKVKLRSVADELLRRISNVLSRLKLEDSNQAKVEAYLKAVTLEYKRGVKNSSDVKNASENLLQSKIKTHMLKTEYYSARSDLQIILGTELSEE